MTREEFINYLVENDIPFNEDSELETKPVYVVEKDSFIKKKKHPRKYKNLFVPYLRISNWDGDRLYVRNCGACYYETEENVIEIVKRLGGIA